MKKFLLHHLFELVILLFMVGLTFSQSGFFRILWVLVMAILFIIYIAVSYSMYIKYDRDVTKEDVILPYRDIPSELSPAGASYLVREKVDLNMVYATLLHLVNKRILSIEKKGEDYLFALQKKNKQLSEVEQYVVQWLFAEEKTLIISMQEFKHLHQGENGRKRLIHHLTNIEKIIKKEVEYLFLDLSHIKKALIKKIVSLMLVEVAVTFLLFGPMTLMLVLVLNLLLVYKAHNLMKKTEEGKREYLKWLGYSEFLKEQMEAGRRETHEIILWDHYMTYAVALGRANTSIKELDWLEGNIVEVNNGTSFTAQFG